MGLDQNKEWTEYKKEGIAVEPKFREKMIKEEKRMEKVLQEKIDNLVKEIDLGKANGIE